MRTQKITAPAVDRNRTEKSQETGDVTVGLGKPRVSLDQLYRARIQLKERKQMRFEIAILAGLGLMSLLILHETAKILRLRPEEEYLMELTDALIFVLMGLGIDTCRWGKRRYTIWNEGYEGRIEAGILNLEIDDLKGELSGVEAERDRLLALQADFVSGKISRVELEAEMKKDQ